MKVSLDVLFRAEKLSYYFEETKSLQVLQEMRALQDEIRRLAFSQIKLEQELDPAEVSIKGWSDGCKHPIYCADEDSKSILGPYCGDCWARHQVLERLQYLHSRYTFVCPACNAAYA